MSRLTGQWTAPGKPFPSSHLIVAEEGGQTRCGLWLERHAMDEAVVAAAVTSEPPARGRTCESCLRYSRRDG